MTEPLRLTADDRAASQALIDAYAESWTRINDAQLALANSPANARKRARLAELSAMVSREVVKLDATAQAYLKEKFPTVYTLAAIRGAKAVDPAATAYVQPNRRAAQLLADGLERELLQATKNVDESTKQLVRRIGRDAGLKTALDGNTAKQAATEMRRILQQSGIHAVTYANGARVGLKAYTEMAIRTSTALALNQGAIQGSADAGCLFWEVFDGQSCGWKNHKDPDRAHGKVVSREEALANPIAHPNCRRALGPRPDLGVDKKVRPPVDTVTQQQVAARADGNTPSVSREPLRGPERRVEAASTRAATAQARAASAQAKVTQSAARRQVAELPDRSPTETDKVYPEYLFELAKIDKRIKATTTQGDLAPAVARAKELLSAADFDPDRASEYDLLQWMQKTAGDLGFGDNLAVSNAAVGKHNQKRIIRYLVDGGEMPDPIDLKRGTTKNDVFPIYPRTDADSFRQLTPGAKDGGQRASIAEFNEIWGDPQLTPAQSAVLRAYSRGSDRQINNALRKGAGDGPRVNAVRAAMRPLPESIRVVRGVEIDALGYRAPLDRNNLPIRDDQAYAEYLRGMVGQDIKDPGFLSTSVNPGGAFSGDVELRIDVPEGFRGAWVEPFSSSPGEAELLLDRGTRLEIYRVDVSDAATMKDGNAKGRVAKVYARVVHQDDMHDYDPAKAKAAAEARATVPESRKTPATRTPKSPALPAKLPPPPAPKVPASQATPAKVEGPLDEANDLGFDVPKRPNAVSKGRIVNVESDGTVIFDDGTAVQPNGMTWRNGAVVSQGGTKRARWAKEVRRLWNENNRKPDPVVPPPTAPSSLAQAKAAIEEAAQARRV